MELAQSKTPEAKPQRGFATVTSPFRRVVLPKAKLQKQNRNAVL
jgi:hypothetical protein